MTWWKIAIAGVAAIPASAMAQSYDDPRVGDYTWYATKTKEAELQVLALRAQICQQGRVLQRPELAQYCEPMQFRPMMTPEEFRAKLAKQ